MNATAVAATPKPASTLLLVRERDRGSGIEVFMMERAATVDFPGVHVFPGGKVDPQDAALASSPERLRGGRADVEVSRRMGLSAGGLAYWITALRECYEEAGVLLGVDAQARDAGAWDDALHDALAAARTSVAAGTLPFEALLERHDLTLTLDRLEYFSHWITPPVRPRRYDTRFFIAAAPPGSYGHDDGELVNSHWIAPAAALAHADSGDWQLIMPTRSTLEVLADFGRVDDLLASVARGTHLPPLTQFLRNEGMQAVPDA